MPCLPCTLVPRPPAIDPPRQYSPDSFSHSLTACYLHAVDIATPACTAPCCAGAVYSPAALGATCAAEPSSGVQFAPMQLGTTDETRQVEPLDWMSAIPTRVYSFLYRLSVLRDGVTVRRSVSR